MQVLKGRSNISFAVEIEGNIGRMVVILIHLPQLGVLQIHDISRATSRVKDIGCASEELLVYFPHQLPICILVGPLHLIQHDPLQLSLSLTI